MGRRTDAMLGAVAFALVASGGVHGAMATPPADNTQLVGTWSGLTPDNDVLTIIITAAKTGAVTVHPYDVCTPTPCDMGKHRAITYAASIGSATAIGFSVQFNLSYGVERLTAHLVPGPNGAGMLLEVTDQIKFAPGDSRVDFEQTEDFVLSSN